MNNLSLPEEFAEYWSYSNSGPLGEAVRLRDEIIRATARAEALKEAAKPQWISVKDRLPEYKQLVAICDTTEAEPAVFMAFYFEAEKIWACGDIKFDSITHWMPLPEPPAILSDKQEENNV